MDVVCEDRFLEAKEEIDGALPLPLLDSVAVTVIPLEDARAAAVEDEDDDAVGSAGAELGPSIKFCHCPVAHEFSRDTNSRARSCFVWKSEANSTQKKKTYKE